MGADQLMYSPLSVALFFSSGIKEKVGADQFIYSPLSVA